MSSRAQAYDVAVVGGGVIGLAVAWRAADAGLRTIVLERDTVGAGASRVAAGMLAPVSEADAQEPALLELGLRSAALWPAFAEDLRDASGIDPGLRTQGTLMVARDRDEAEALDREASLRRRLGLDVERLLPSAARRLEPALAPSLRAALVVPGDHSADPRALIAGLAEAARRAGAEIREGATVTSAAPLGLAHGQAPRAAQVVVAAGAWSRTLADVPVRPVKGQTIRLRSRAGEPPLLAHTVRFEGGYLVPRADGRIVLGATVEERGFDTAMTAGAVYELLRDAAELVPGVLELEIEEIVAGLRPGTPDNLPRVERLPNGVIVATGHYRNGILLAPVTAELVREHLLRRSHGVAA